MLAHECPGNSGLHYALTPQYRRQLQIGWRLAGPQQHESDVLMLRSVAEEAIQVPHNSVEKLRYSLALCQQLRVRFSRNPFIPLVKNFRRQCR